MISIGIVGLVSLVSVADGLRIETNKAFESLNRITVSSGATLGKLALSDADKIEGIQGVEVANPAVQVSPKRLNGRAIYGSKIGQTTVYPYIIGYDPERMARSHTYPYIKDLITGRPLRAGDQYQAMVGKAVADAYGLHYRSSMDLDGTEFEVVGIYATGVGYTENTIAVPLETAQRMASLNAGQVNTFDVDVYNPKDALRVALTIQNELHGVNVTTPEQVKSQVAGLESTVKNVVWVIALVAVVVAGVGVIVIMWMTVSERRREIGILKAVGWTKGEILRTFLLESILICARGGIVGILIGYVAVTWGLGAILPALPAQVTPMLALEAMALAVGLGAVAGLLPAWRAASVDPIEALRYA
jgi:putative ABC transport system permease protein